MITLTLLHPVQATPVQSWTFEHEAVIRIGRAVDNHVVLYSAVVSRHHVELRRNGLHWEVVNLGTNGTYLDGKRVQQASLNDGGVLRLARSGPNIQIRIGPTNQPAPPNARMDTIPEKGTVPEQYADPSKMTIGGLRTEVETKAQSSTQASDDDEESDRDFQVVGDLPLEFLGQPMPSTCEHHTCGPTDVFCPLCGQPAQALQTLGAYQILRAVEPDLSYLAWRAGRTVLLKSLPEMAAVAERSTFRHQARQLCQLSHGALPRFYEAFAVAGRPYLSTEMIYGQTLQAWVSQHGPLNLATLCQWLRPVCELLDYVHSQHPPLMHLHLQPRSLVRPTLPRPGSDLVLTGWGHIPVITAETGTMMHSGGYTAPEQQAGHPQPASDLYSLGATLLYLLTGYDPDAYYRWGVKEFRLYAEDVPHMIVPVADVINRLTHPDPQARFSSALAALEILEALV